MRLCFLLVLLHHKAVYKRLTSRSFLDTVHCSQSIAIGDLRPNIFRTFVQQRIVKSELCVSRVNEYSS